VGPNYHITDPEGYNLAWAERNEVFLESFLQSIDAEFVGDDLSDKEERDEILSNMYIALECFPIDLDAYIKPVLDFWYSKTHKIRSPISIDHEEGVIKIAWENKSNPNDCMLIMEFYRSDKTDDVFVETNVVEGGVWDKTAKKFTLTNNLELPELIELMIEVLEER
jgi:hypothetical protein